MQQPVMWAVGQLEPFWTVQIIQDNNQPLPLTGVTTNQLSFIIYNASYAQIATGTGLWSIVNAADGIVQYAFATNDVPTVPGTYYVRIKVNFNGSQPFMTDYIKWIVQP